MADIAERLTAHIGDRYAIERELGRGGMATVYLARDLKHEREVAIKVLHPELSATIGGERFEREIKLAAKLQHPNILGLFDSGVADGLLFYVMPFVQGESLRDRLDREGQLPVDDALQIVIEVAEALGHAHERGIVHRDVKPENILLSGGHALVADFGIARAAGEAASGPKLTQTGMALGTPLYMAPEQAVGEVVGPTADLYSLGCVLYEMLAGEPPYSGKNAAALMARHAMETIPSIRIVRQSVPEEVEEAIIAAMGKVPADRPQTAAQFVEILGQPFGATATRRVALRHTATRRVPGAITQALPIARAPWWRRPVAIGVGALLLAGGGIGAWLLARGSGGPRPLLAGGLDPHNVAVLYLEDATPDQRLGDVADGLTEALLINLGQVQGLRVVSKGGVEPFRGANVPPDSIGRALSAGTLVMGSVDQPGDRLRVSLSLVEGNNGSVIQRTSFERPAANLLAVRDSLAVEVTRLIREWLGEEIRLRTQRQSTSNLQAWSLVQRAERLRKSGDAAARTDLAQMQRDFRAADSLLALAEELDARWADPVVHRGLLAYRQSRLSGLDPYAARDKIAEGLAHADRALAIDPNNADGLELRGNLRYWKWLLGLEADPDSAAALLAATETDFEAATRINPNQAGAWASLSHLKAQNGTSVDVNLAARRALEADAFLSNADVILNRLFLSSYDLGNFPDAERACAEIRRRFPTSMNAPRCELYLLGTRARPADPALAWALADTAQTRAPAARAEFERLKSNILVAAVLARANQGDSARRIIERSRGNPEIDASRDLLLFGAFVYTQMGARDEAINLLKEYLAANERRRKGFLDEPGWWFGPIADDPRLIQLVRGRT